MVYDELRSLARAMMRSQRQDHTLQPTALVNEAYLRMVRQKGARWQDRAHFFRVAATAMRQILVNYARDRLAAKRGGNRVRVTLSEEAAVEPARWLELISLDDALTRLSERDERMARTVELRVFAGMTVPEVAHVLKVSPRTVNSDWKVAKMWLLDELRGDGAS